MAPTLEIPHNNLIWPVCSGEFNLGTPEFISNRQETTIQSGMPAFGRAAMMADVEELQEFMANRRERPEQTGQIKLL